MPDTVDGRTIYAESQYLGLTIRDNRTWETRSVRPGDPRGTIDPRRNFDAWFGGRQDPELGNAMAPAEATAKWQTLPPSDRRLTGARALELTDSTEEAQAIALALRETLETPGRTAALVTPDRQLARRVAAHLKRLRDARVPVSLSPAMTLS